MSVRNNTAEATASKTTAKTTSCTFRILPRGKLGAVFRLTPQLDEKRKSYTNSSLFSCSSQKAEEEEARAALSLLSVGHAYGGLRIAAIAVALLCVSGHITEAEAFLLMAAVTVSSFGQLKRGKNKTAAAAWCGLWESEGEEGQKEENELRLVWPLHIIDENSPLLARDDNHSLKNADGDSTTNHATSSSAWSTRTTISILSPPPKPLLRHIRLLFVEAVAHCIFVDDSVNAFFARDLYPTTTTTSTVGKCGHQSTTQKPLGGEENSDMVGSNQSNTTFSDEYSILPPTLDCQDFSNIHFAKEISDQLKSMKTDISLVGGGASSLPRISLKDDKKSTSSETKDYSRNSATPAKEEEDDEERVSIISYRNLFEKWWEMHHPAPSSTSGSAGAAATSSESTRKSISRFFAEERGNDKRRSPQMNELIRTVDGVLTELLGKN